MSPLTYLYCSSSIGLIDFPVSLIADLLSELMIFRILHPHLLDIKKIFGIQT